MRLTARTNKRICITALRPLEACHSNSDSKHDNECAWRRERINESRPPPIRSDCDVHTLWLCEGMDVGLSVAGRAVIRAPEVALDAVSPAIQFLRGKDALVFEAAATEAE